MPSLEHLVGHYIRFGDGLPCRLKTAISTDQQLTGLEIFPSVEQEQESARRSHEVPGLWCITCII